MLNLSYYGKEPITKESKDIIQELLNNPQDARKHTEENKLILKDGRDEVTHIVFVAVALDNEVEPVGGTNNPTKEYLFVVSV